MNKGPTLLFSMLFTNKLLAALRQHWPHYLAEAAGIAFFVACSGLLAMLIKYPGSPVHQALPDNELLRRGLIGLGVCCVLVLIVYSPWGKRSGAHINPAVTLAFWQLGKIKPADALWYVLAQVAGAIGAAQVLKHVCGDWYAHPTIKYNVTQPAGPTLLAALVAFGAEFLMAFLLMQVTLYCLHSARLKEWTGWLLGALLALYVTFEAPLSGMSVNPARTLGTAVAAGRYEALWVYWLAPPLAMWLATVAFRRFHHGQPLECAILAGCAPAAFSSHAPAQEEPPQYPDEQAA